MYGICKSVLIEFWIVVTRGYKAEFSEFENHRIEHHGIDSMVEYANDSPQQTFVVDDFLFLSSAIWIVESDLEFHSVVFI